MEVHFVREIGLEPGLTNRIPHAPKKVSHRALYMAFKISRIARINGSRALRGQPREACRRGSLGTPIVCRWGVLGTARELSRPRRQHLSRREAVGDGRDAST